MSLGKEAFVGFQGSIWDGAALQIPSAVHSNVSHRPHSATLVHSMQTKLFGNVWTLIWSTKTVKCIITQLMMGEGNVGLCIKHFHKPEHCKTIAQL
jgi:hypothetical protein